MVTYEFWFNFLNELKKRKVQTILISGIFKLSLYGTDDSKSLRAGVITIEIHVLEYIKVEDVSTEDATCPSPKELTSNDNKSSEFFMF